MKVTIREQEPAVELLLGDVEVGDVARLESTGALALVLASDATTGWRDRPRAPIGWPGHVSVRDVEFDGVQNPPFGYINLDPRDRVLAVYRMSEVVLEPKP